MPLLRSLKLTSLLSFGPAAAEVKLGALNVLIGPNGSGKSNFIEAIGLLRSAPGDLLAPVRAGGGALEWIWKGDGGTSATIEAVVEYPRWRLASPPRALPPLRHRLAFELLRGQLQLAEESIEDAAAHPQEKTPHLYYGEEGGARVLKAVAAGKRGRTTEEDPRPIDPRQSVLSRRRDPPRFPELAHLDKAYGAIRLFRDWRFGRLSPPRLPQPADALNEHLAEDASNLGLVLNRLRQDVPTKRAILAHLRDVFEGAEDFDVSIVGGTVQISLQEAGDRMIPASRLSDGTVRWLALLALLLDPTPPPLICIEEPELGLHPDLMPPLARLLRQASERTQLVVTTHSDTLVDAFTSTPEVVLVCEKEAGTTTLRRLDAENLAGWLEAYSLGQLWSMGEIGGTRW